MIPLPTHVFCWCLCLAASPETKSFLKRRPHVNSGHCPCFLWLQIPGALGWLLVAGAVAAAPLLGAVRSGTVYRRPALRWFLGAAEAVGAAWLVVQYAAEVWWLRVSGCAKRMCKMRPF